MSRAERRETEVATYKEVQFASTVVSSTKVSAVEGLGGAILGNTICWIRGGGNMLPCSCWQKVQHVISNILLETLGAAIEPVQHNRAI